MRKAPPGDGAGRYDSWVTTETPQPARMEWMDELRGAAILLVIAHHVLTIPAVLGGTSPSWQPVMDALLPYRMPLMLVLSGLLLSQSLRKGPRVYYGGKIRKVLWPYLLWIVLTALVLLRPDVLLSPWTWIGGAWHLWFLAVLLACYLVAPLTRWFPAWMWPVPMVVLAQSVDTGAFERILWFGAFFFAGAALLPYRDRWQAVRPVAPALLGVGAVAAGVWIATGGAWEDQSPWAFLVSAAGILALVWIASRLPRMPLLATVGRQSIVYYLAHFPVIGVAYLVIGDTSWWVLGPVLAVVGYGVPWLMSRWVESPLFVLPVGRRAREGAHRPSASVSSR